MDANSPNDVQSLRMEFDLYRLFTSFCEAAEAKTKDKVEGYESGPFDQVDAFSKWNQVPRQNQEYRLLYHGFHVAEYTASCTAKFLRVISKLFPQLTDVVDELTLTEQRLACEFCDSKVGVCGRQLLILCQQEDPCTYWKKLCAKDTSDTTSEIQQMRSFFLDTLMMASPTGIAKVSVSHLLRKKFSFVSLEDRRAMVTELIEDKWVSQSGTGAGLNGARLMLTPAGEKSLADNGGNEIAVRSTYTDEAEDEAEDEEVFEPMISYQTQMTSLEEEEEVESVDASLAPGTVVSEPWHWHGLFLLLDFCLKEQRKELRSHANSTSSLASLLQTKLNGPNLLVRHENSLKCYDHEISCNCTIVRASILELLHFNLEMRRPHFSKVFTMFKKNTLPLLERAIWRMHHEVVSVQASRMCYQLIRMTCYCFRFFQFPSTDSVSVGNSDNKKTQQKSANASDESTDTPANSGSTETKAQKLEKTKPFVVVNAMRNLLEMFLALPSSALIVVPDSLEKRMDGSYDAIVKATQAKEVEVDIWGWIQVYADLCQVFQDSKCQSDVNRFTFYVHTARLFPFIDTTELVFQWPNHIRNARAHNQCQLVGSRTAGAAICFYNVNKTDQNFTMTASLRFLMHVLGDIFRDCARHHQSKTTSILHFNRLARENCDPIVDSLLFSEAKSLSPRWPSSRGMSLRGSPASWTPATRKSTSPFQMSSSSSASPSPDKKFRKKGGPKKSHYSSH